MPESRLPRYLRLESALARFINVLETQGQRHIKPLHQHIAIRLVIEGGFHPDEITPHPPLVVEGGGGRQRLVFDASVERENEQTVLGGLKTKDIDVVVTKPSVGPVIAVSVKGTGGAFRNLTNRMEEAIGDSTNLHIMYPGLVYAFLHVLKAHRAGTANLSPNDIAVAADGEVVQSIRRYHDVLLGLAGRRLVRDDYTRYEAVALALVESSPKTAGTLFSSFPLGDSPLGIMPFFETIYRIYDLRFPYVAASVAGLKRLDWDAASPALTCFGSEDQIAARLGYRPRVG
ncbi:MAG: hypothetical protein HY735_35675 [Verrucomicrobia bacterium]|nr:hypothetical protein [Verrucomicrobiota bacterium]